MGKRLPAGVSRSVACIRPDVSQFAEPEALVPDPKQRNAENTKYRSGGKRSDHKPIRALARRRESEALPGVLRQSNRVVIQNQRIPGQDYEQAGGGSPQQTGYQELPAAAQPFQRRLGIGGRVGGHITLPFPFFSVCLAPPCLLTLLPELLGKSPAVPSFSAAAETRGSPFTFILSPFGLSQFSGSLQTRLES